MTDAEVLWGGWLGSLPENMGFFHTILLQVGQGKEGDELQEAEGSSSESRENSAGRMSGSFHCMMQQAVAGLTWVGGLNSKALSN